MKIPKHLAERRDHLSEIRTMCSLEPSTRRYAKDWYCFGYNQAVEDMLKEVEPLLEALRLVELDYQEYFGMAGEALDAWKLKMEDK